MSQYEAKKWFVFIISVHTYLYEPLSVCEPLEKLKDSDNVLSVCGNNSWTAQSKIGAEYECVKDRSRRCDCSLNARFCQRWTWWVIIFLPFICPDCTSPRLQHPREFGISSDRKWIFLPCALEETSADTVKMQVLHHHPNLKRSTEEGCPKGPSSVFDTSLTFSHTWRAAEQTVWSSRGAAQHPLSPTWTTQTADIVPQKWFLYSCKTEIW